MSYDTTDPVSHLPSCEGSYTPAPFLAPAEFTASWDCLRFPEPWSAGRDLQRSRMEDGFRQEVRRFVIDPEPEGSG